MTRLIWSIWVLVIGTIGVALASGGATTVITCVGYAGDNPATFAYDGTRTSAIGCDATVTLPAEEKRNGRDGGSDSLAKFGKLLAAEGGRLGNQATRQHVADVATEMESRGWTITGGGGKLPEEYLRGPNGRLGSSYPDITATKNGHTLRVNTVDTYADGVTPTAREAANAARIRAQTPGDHLLLVPKP